MLIHVQDGATPLYIASWNGHAAVVKLLLQQHADIGISGTVIFQSMTCVLADVYDNVHTLPLYLLWLESPAKIFAATCNKALCVMTEITRFTVCNKIHLVF